MIDGLAPIHFFRLHIDIPEGKPRSHLPNNTDLLGEDHFADCALSWSESGLHAGLHVHKQFESAVYPKFTQGDALELFIDTRDLKEAGFPTRFCHHFLILPQEVQGVRALELTRLRTDDAHPLCDPELIEVKFLPTSHSYELEIFLPTEILFGYDPLQFNQLGFTYTVHRAGGPPQNFALSSTYVSIAQNPSLWASCTLK